MIHRFSTLALIQHLPLLSLTAKIPAVFATFIVLVALHPDVGKGDEEIAKIEIIESERGYSDKPGERPRPADAVDFSRLANDRYIRSVEQRDLFYSYAKYQALLGNDFEAILIWRTELKQYRQIDNPDRDTLHSLAYLSGYRIGERAIEFGLLPSGVDEIAYLTNKDLPTELYHKNVLSLASSYSFKGLSSEVIDLLQEAGAGSPEQELDRLEWLAFAEYAQREYEEAAENFDRSFNEEDIFFALAPHNYGATLIHADKIEDGLDELIATGVIDAEENPELWAIRDRANLALGYYLLESDLPEQALIHFNRVRIVGPYSNPALLGSGWSHLAMGNYDKALVPWLRLRQNEVTDPYVLESYLGVPYAYAQLNVHGRAALNFGMAIEVLESEQLRVEDSMTAIRGGGLLKNRQQRLDDGYQWLYHLREEEGSPEMRYLVNLMSQREFQHALDNYREISKLEKHLEAWRMRLDTLREIVREKRDYYTDRIEKIQPRLEAVFERARQITIRAKEIDSELRVLLDRPQAVKLASTNEIDVRRELDSIVRGIELARKHPHIAGVYKQIDRLYGILHWEQDRLYYSRLKRAIDASDKLNEVIERTNDVYDSTQRDLLISSSGYSGQEEVVARLRLRLKRLIQRVAELRVLQGQSLNELALIHLDERLNRIDSYLIKARFAIAEAFDRKISANKEERERTRQRAIEESARTDPSSDASDSVETLDTEVMVPEGVENERSIQPPSPDSTTPPIQEPISEGGATESDNERSIQPPSPESTTPPIQEPISEGGATGSDPDTR